MAHPGFDFTAPAQAPAPSGLYDAAIVTNNTAEALTRTGAGVTVWPRNCGPSGTWTSGPCARPERTIQNITLTDTPDGTFTATADGETTTAIDFDATAAELEAALEALPNVTDVTVTGTPGDWDIEFVDPRTMPLLVLDDTLLGGTATATIIAAGSRKGGDRPGPSELFDPITAWGWDECGPAGATNEQRDNALQNLALNERLLVEAAFAPRLIADAGAPTAVVSIYDAVARLSADLLADGIVGTIHASAYWTEIAAAVGLITRQGEVYRTALGHAWAGGGGYVGGLGNTIVATGQVFIWRDPATVREDFHYPLNLRVALAERTVLVAYEPCHVSAVTVPALTSGGGGGGGGGGLYPAP